MMAAPSMGPRKVNHPPKRHMIRISRERVQKSISGKSRVIHHNEENARDSGEEPCNHKGYQLLKFDVDPNGLAPDRVIPNSLERASKRGLHNPIHDEQAGTCNEESEIITSFRSSNHGGHGDTVNSIVPACNRIPPVGNNPY